VQELELEVSTANKSLQQVEATLSTHKNTLKLKQRELKGTSNLLQFSSFIEHLLDALQKKKESSKTSLQSQISSGHHLAKGSRKQRQRLKCATSK
jgi:hypothetical protein